MKAQEKPNYDFTAFDQALAAFDEGVKNFKEFFTK